ncbi:hypothetical protein BK133_22745 [Paenibacillus sp. FSL H8-0548]|nr:SET domain-containing protein [Paenibacillus sp. FSL H8-0548]OMF24540.1 hypothetical protein BK133_22745 [Paenibacillus sp. FSL H8-0548]
MNHSFHPTCIDTVFEFILAERNIYPGEQLTCDYGIVGVDDYLYLSQEWDEMAREAFKYFNSVEQLLKHLIKKEYAEEVKAVAAGLLSLPSILTLFVDKSEEDGEEDEA